MSNQLPATPGITTHVGIAAEVRLHQLGVPGSPVLVDAVRDGASGYRNTTPLHPVGYGGQRMWGETVNSTRRGLIPHGWEPETVSGVDLTVNRVLGISIIVVSGDESTGRSGLAPEFRYDHPRVLRQIVGGHLDTLWETPGERPEWEVWFLLHQVGPRSVNAELSRPRGIAPSGSVTGWSERILLPDQPFAGPGARSSSGSGTGTGSGTSPAAVDVPVRRRAG